MPGDDTVISVSTSVATSDDGGRARANVSMFFVPEGEMDSVTMSISQHRRPPELIL
jgi:hypothetical protein